jgi:lambda repressor-like predicted transcriptional regulator
MRLSLDRALLCIQLIVEGNSIRSTERITGVHRDTILALLVKAGQRCEKLLADTITGLRVRDVQADEMWGFVAMKEKAKTREQQGIDTLGDAYKHHARCARSGAGVDGARSGCRRRRCVQHSRASTDRTRGRTARRALSDNRGCSR